MANILTEQDTFFGTIAYRNQLITREQLSQAVLKVQNTPDLRLGDAFAVMGFLSQAQVDAILAMQKEQRVVLEAHRPPAPPRPGTAPVAPPLPARPTRPPVIDFTMPGVGEKGGAAPPPAPAVSARPATPAVPAPSPAPAPAVLPAAPAPVVEVGAADRLKPPATFGSLHDYLAYARAAGASDLHISADVRPFLRHCKRILQLDMQPLAAHETEHLFFAALSRDQQAVLLAQHSLEFCLDVPGEGRYRSAIYKQRLGWDGIFHIIPNRVPTFEELGLPPCLERLTEYQQGLVLVTGPSNSGKTTTLAGLVDIINRKRTDHIITLEQPVEYVHVPQKCQVTQRAIGDHTKSFAMALRAALREDPDVIMVGELRDQETLSMAITASETGHLVLGTLPTTSAAATVGRVVDAFPVGQQGQIRMMISESLRGVISQQLLPRKDGKGVVLALEILFITSAVSALIRDNQPFQIPSVIQVSRKLGMCRMEDSLLELVNQDLLDGAEAWRRTENKELFARYAPKRPAAGGSAPGGSGARMQPGAPLAVGGR
jgi:twitching motility protein PilT